MPKVPLSTISSGYGTVDALNANFDAIEAAFDNTLSRDGSTPNHMVANFDMNGKNILNAGTVYTGGINIGGVDLEPGDSVASATVQVFEYVATAGQTTFSVAPLSPTTSALLVEVNGLAIPSSLVVVSGSLVSIPAREVNDAVILRVFTKLIGAPETTLASEISFAYNQAYPAGSVGFGLKGGYGINITQAPFYADSTGVQDVGPAIEAAHVAFPGVPLYAPAGTYRLSTKPNIKTSVYDGVFGAGVKLFGDGALKTYFINDISNDAAIDIDSDVNHATTFKAAFGVTLQGFTLKRTSTTTNGTGIRLRTSYNVSIKDVYVLGMSGDGINIPCSVGDNDGSNMVFLEHVRIENCAGWGFNAAADSGFNETSYINMQHVFIQGCGTTNANFTPPSGGMAWKGQVLSMKQCALTINENCALWIPGQAGLAQCVDLQSVSFENNKARNLFCRGVSLFKGRNLQFYNNNTYTASVSCEFDGSSFVIRQVDIDGVVVRATSGNNPYTAFKISGVNTNIDSCRVKNVVWDNFDYTGQTRFDGWKFDHVPNCCDAVAASATSFLLRPNLTRPRGVSIPIRLRGGAGGVPSTTGEWVERQLPPTGFSASNSGLAANTRYYVYFYDNNGADALEFSTTAFTYDATHGYPVKTGDATKLYVGSVETNASSEFKTTAGGWLNPLLVPASQPGTYNRLWFDGSGVLRFRASTIEPTNDTDGTVVGTQT